MQVCNIPKKASKNRSKHPTSVEVSKHDFGRPKGDFRVNGKKGHDDCTVLWGAQNVVKACETQRGCTDDVVIFVA